jgi:hypothetical protein
MSGKNNWQAWRKSLRWLPVRHIRATPAEQIVANAILLRCNRGDHLEELFSLPLKDLRAVCLTDSIYANEKKESVVRFFDRSESIPSKQLIQGKRQTWKKSG